MSGSLIEEAVQFVCDGQRLTGILSRSSTETQAGVLVITGGPQYRIGSHRQFVELARALAHKGNATFRFDYRGMGDGEGEARSFDDVQEDIRQALACFRARCPGLRQVVLWGLCDGASAAAFFTAAAGSGVAGLVLLNPWVRSEAGQARSLLRQYYGPRLLSGAFWRRVLRGGVGLRQALGSFVTNLQRACRPPVAAESITQPRDSLPTRLGHALRGFRGPVLIVLSGRDLTAAEFRQACRDDPVLRHAVGRPGVEWQDVPEADHTFSSTVWKRRVEEITADWLCRLPATAAEETGPVRDIRVRTTARVSPAVRPAPRPDGPCHPT